MGLRKWSALKLVRLAHRIYDATWYETVKIGDVEILIEADSYGGGIQMMYGDCDWKDHDTHEEALDYLCPEVVPVVD